MKPILLIFTLLLCSQCKSKQDATVAIADHYLQITLEKRANPEHIVKDFKADGLTTLKASSRSQPSYAAVVRLSRPNLDKLIQSLKQDNRIQNVVVLDKEPSATHNSTNNGFGTSQPKK